MIKKIGYNLLKGVGLLIAIVLIVGVVFVNTSPEFGGEYGIEKVAEYKKTGHFDGEVFLNLEETSLDMSFKNVVKMLGEFMDGVPNSRPNFELPVLKVDSMALENNTNSQLIWFGHSAFLLQLEGMNILLDPMFGDVPAPSPYLGQKRYSSTLPISIEKLPVIDAIVISHDHYDHLDYGSIKKLMDKTKMFYVPLGVGAHFIEWGVDPSQIVEMSWWETSTLGDVSFSFTPSRHFSGRGITNRNSTLWGSWVITGKKENLFFSGDGGYGAHFKEIGNRFGPFDLAMVECGQYNEKWKMIHMMPEQSAQAGVDVRAKTIMPIHWGAFTLAMHSWTDPVERITAKSLELGIPVITPKIGEQVHLKKLSKSEYQSKWWMN